MTIPVGWVEKTFAVLLLAYITLLLFSAPSSVTLLGLLVVCFFGAWSLIRVGRKVSRQVLWSLRNRLIVAYLLIALVPVVLISVLAGLGGYLLGGQLSIYLITSEMERRTAALRDTVEFLAMDTGDRVNWGETVAPYLATRYPGLHIVVESRRTQKYPVGSDVDPPGAWPEGNGLVLKDGVLYGWAHAVYGSRRATALFPLTREFLGKMAPDLCESAILDLRSRDPLMHPSLPGSEPSHNRLPPAVNRFDIEILWSVPISVSVWETPGQALDKWLSIRTRPSALVRSVSARPGDWASELVPMIMFLAAILFFIAELIAMIVGVSLTRTITSAIHELYKGTLRIRTGDFAHRIPIRGDDQLAEVGVSFNQMTGDLQRLLAVEKERERLHAELEIAREVQNQLYPKSTPDVKTLNVTAACSPARMVSGDYYDYQQIDADRVALAIGDVAGKGISAALLMATVQSSFRSQIRGSLELAMSAQNGDARASLSTSRLVAHLNKQLYADTSPEKYATFYLGVYDDATGVLTYTNAGHLPPVLVSNTSARRLEVNGMVVGAFPFAKYGESEVQLEPGDLVLFFTDGITEPEDAYGEQFGEDRLIDLVVRNAHLEDRAIVECILTSVREWTGSDELQDDMTLLLVRRR